jgi:hypothetical protein
MTAPEHKYSDRDVRADPDLAELAYEYLDAYTGDFEPLIRAQEVLADSRLLTTSQIRVVLNCMRHDWNIADQLPHPMAKVIEMPQRDNEVVVIPKPKKFKEPSWKDRYVPCERTDLHPPHAYEAKGYDQWRCDGLHNDREDHLFIDARIKTPYVKAPGGKMIHLLGAGSYFHWHPYRYGNGFGGLSREIGMSEADKSLWGRYPPDLVVKLLCKHPSWLRKPMLLWELPDNLITNDGTPIKLCIHCKAVRDASD